MSPFTGFPFTLDKSHIINHEYGMNCLKLTIRVTGIHSGSINVMEGMNESESEIGKGNWSLSSLPKAPARRALSNQLSNHNEME